MGIKLLIIICRSLQIVAGSITIYNNLIVFVELSKLYSYDRAMMSIE